MSIPRVFNPAILRLALRDLRGGLAGLRILLLCVALGVATIAGVNSLSRSLGDGLARDGRVILGGDASFSVIHRELSAAERDFLSARGDLSTIGLMRAMARKDDGAATLTEIKAVEATWPRLGEASLSPTMSLSTALAKQGDVWGAAVDPLLAPRLDLKLGDTFLLGDQRFALRAFLNHEPDELAAGLGLGPRILIAREALDATGLVQPGSLVRWTTRVLMRPGGEPPPEASVDAFVAAAKKAFPEAGWEVRTRSAASPQFARNIDSFTEFLSLIGLTSLIVGGVGVANAASGFVERKRPTLAILKSVGASGGAAVAMASIEFLAVATLGCAIGLALGAALPFAIQGLFSSLIPFPLAPAIFPGELVLGLAYGLLTAILFAIPALGRAHDWPVSALFRSLVEGSGWPRPRYLVIALLAAVALAALAIAESPSKRLALTVVVATALGFASLRLVAFAGMALARRAPRASSLALRMAVANLHRPGALTPSVVLSLGLGLAVLVTLTLVDQNLRGELRASLPGQTPSFYFLDVRSADLEPFRAFLTEQQPSLKLDEAPMMRGRFVRIGDVPAESAKVSENAAWALEGDRGVTYSAALPKGSELTQGQWWAPDYAGPPLVSLEAEVAAGLGLKVGDRITVNVLGRNVEATIANLRKVNWRSFAINFVMVFSPDTFRGAPHTVLVSAAWPQPPGDAAEFALLRETSKRFPSVVSLRVRDALDAIDALVAKLALAIRAASGVALATAALVLAGALAANQDARIRDSTVLKILGATRRQLIGAYVLEFALLGAATVVFGVAAGIIAASLIVTRVMQLEFAIYWGPALAAGCIALVAAVGLGLAGAWRSLGLKPAAVLREL